MVQGIAIVTGSNKGIGRAIVKELCQKFDGITYLAARDEERGKQAVSELEKEGFNAKFLQLDIDNIESIKKCGEFIKETHGGIDILVNNAAIAFKHAAAEPFNFQAEETCRVNFFGTLNVCNVLFPLLRKNARVVNISSSCGVLAMIDGQEPAATQLREKFKSPTLTVEQLSQLVNNFVTSTNEGNHGEKGYPNSAYKVSKVAVSALTIIQQREMDKNRPVDNILINAVHPGYVNTDMSSGKGPLTVEEGAAAPSMLALLGKDVKEPRGGFVWFDKKITDWINGPQ